MRLLWVPAVALLAACGSGAKSRDAVTSDRTKFSVASYGPASPRRTRSRHVRPGGGRYKLGRPYRINGRWYRPRLDKRYDKVGTASWYGPNFHGRSTANGETYNQFALSAAHPTMPLPSYARVTNMENGRSVVVRVNDRGPYAGNRIIDLSGAAADLLGTKRAGLGKVRVQYVGAAPLHGRDARYLKRSFKVVKPKRRWWRLSSLSNRFILAYRGERAHPAFATLERSG